MAHSLRGVRRLPRSREWLLRRNDIHEHRQEVIWPGLVRLRNLVPLVDDKPSIQKGVHVGIKRPMLSIESYRQIILLVGVLTHGMLI
jgi:hypothetical protein